jgi:hypothetical protein
MCYLLLLFARLFIHEGLEGVADLQLLALEALRGLRRDGVNERLETREIDVA